ncbi:MAG: hypothetical protein Unbinned5179contig1001_4 [Prokaryotic dsDNA virus sp.]|nr:MAG: hypothetical protein Unbinned5179contig1001_4 [Prokaryotic dsDNA virus sp.]|tara:strand:+ start:34747 stop:34989 length:243 start_codon:yes stop_codon:yes gene_type:complete
MALSDSDKDALGWALLVPGFLHMMGELTGEEGFNEAADKLAEVPVEKIAQVLGSLRTDYANIEVGTMEIGEGVAVEIVDD